MGEIWATVVESVTALHPRVRRRRRDHQQIVACIERQDVSEGSFRCDHCGHVQSRHAATAIVDEQSDDATPNVWCVTCVQEAERDRVETRSVLGTGP
jgi:hypothetical protein